MNPTIKYRNLFVQVLLVLVTCGLYVPYWYYQTCSELLSLRKSNQPEQPVVLWTILWFVPPLFFYSYYKQGELFEQIAPEYNRWLILVLWCFLPMAVWVIVQLRLNRVARGALPPEAGAQTAAVQ